MSAVEEHFTARLTIERVRKVPASTEPFSSRRIEAPAPKAEREVVEVLSLTLRADTLESLQAKIRGHLEVEG